MQTMAERAARAAAIQRDIAEQIRAVQGAAKRPEVARKLGVDVRDPEGIVKRIGELKAQLDRWADWPLHADLVAEVKGEPPGTPAGLGSSGTFREVGAQSAPPPDAGFASSGVVIEGVETPLGGMDAINPVLLPEMYRIVQEISGGEAVFLRRYRKANGMFYAVGGGRVGLHPDLFKFPHQLAAVFAHEGLGHGGDYLPDRAIDRGNIFGSIGTLRNWLTTTFPLHPRTSLDEVLKPSDRAKLHREAESAIGPKPGDKADQAAWRERVAERYQELVQQEIDRRGLISLKTVRDELLALTQWWKPYDPATVPESYRKYRESARELYADAISVLFNSPGHLQQRAPTFYKAFWNWLEKKPEFRESMLRVQ
ncbi:MAG: hypothetical protein FJ271_34265, partial [Planctomycetes bacterium]|nr:hypothetical protein [Planctomycetota bacterium]